MLWGLLVGLGRLLVALVVIIGVPILLFLSWLYSKEPLERLQILINQRCPACRGRALKGYRLSGERARGYRLFGCTACHAHFKRTRSREWISLPRGAATQEERLIKLSLPTCRMLKAADDDGDLMGSWFGAVHAALPKQGWPEYNGIPMLPLCQIRCAELQIEHEALRNTEMICVFVSSVGPETVSNVGERWELRSYESVAELVDIEYPGDEEIRSYRTRWEPFIDYPGSLRSCSEDLWIDFLEKDLFSTIASGGSKLGGFPGNWKRAASRTNPHKSDFVFQLHTGGAFPWLAGPGGKFEFCYRNEGESGLWTMILDPPSLSNVTRGMQIVLGCEIDGMELYVQRPNGVRDGPVAQLGMRYGARNGAVRQIDDLVGLVRITTTAMALQFARLRTWGYMHDPITNEREVMTEEVYRQQPNWYRAFPRNPMSVGSLLIRTRLKNDEFVAQRFEHATVEQAEDGYLIRRWTYTPGKRPLATDSFVQWAPGTECPGATYQKIEEAVSHNGSYTRKVLEQRVVPGPVSDDGLLRPASGPNATRTDELVKPATGLVSEAGDDLLRPDG